MRMRTRQRWPGPCVWERRRGAGGGRGAGRRAGSGPGGGPAGGRGARPGGGGFGMFTPNPDAGSWIHEAKYYQFFNDGTEDGKFTITKVRPGTYTRSEERRVGK